MRAAGNLAAKKATLLALANALALAKICLRTGPLRRGDHAATKELPKVIETLRAGD